MDNAFGYVFSHCKITGEPGVKTFLGRPWRIYASTIFLNCEMSDVVRPEGWNDWKKPEAHTTARYAEFIKQVGASEIFHGVATSLTASADAYRDGPWIWSIFVNGRAAWFLTDREIATRRTDTAGNFVFVTEPAVNDANEVQWQAMAGFTVRFDPLSEGLAK